MRILALWIFVIGVALWGFFHSKSQQRTLRMTRIYLAFCAITSSIQLAFWLFWPGVYSDAYWIFDLVDRVVLCALSAEIVWSLLPPLSAICSMAAAVAFPLVVFHDKLPSKLAGKLIVVGTSTSYIGGILLLALFFIPVKRSSEHRTATYGVLALLVGGLLSFFEISGHNGPNQISLVQLAPLVGLILLSFAGRRRQADKPLGNAEKLQEIQSKPESAREVDPVHAKSEAELKKSA